MFLRAYVFIGTNAVRVLSIIALILVFASNILVMVDDIKSVHRGDTASFTTTDASGNVETIECDYFEGSTVPNQPAGAFWAVLNRLFILFTAIILTLSEVGWPESFFRNFLPVLGPEFGVGILGAVQWITAASILSHHVEEFPLVSAWFLFAIGCLNIILGLLYRSDIKVKRSITTFRETKAKELLPGPVQNAAPSFKILETSVGSIFSHDEKGRLSRNNTGASQQSGDHSAGGFGSGYGFGRQGEKAANLKGKTSLASVNLRRTTVADAPAFDPSPGFMISRPVDSLPRYAPRPPKSDTQDSDDEGNSPFRGNRI
ncbi:hypothetical protein FRB90_002027 [Tulasnella sp. 427]|nr:hypothetical protein FRB90_002027 [Tulasnella sp. 427]